LLTVSVRQACEGTEASPEELQCLYPMSSHFRAHAGISHECAHPPTVDATYPPSAVSTEVGQKSLLDPDEIPKARATAVTRMGEIWTLGQHQVLCGDGTRGEDLARVLDGRPCDLVFTDLPYNVNYCGKGPDKLKLANDNLGTEFGNFLREACRAMLAVCVGPLYVCMSSGELHRLYAAFTESGGHWSTYVIWAKNTFTLGWSDYQRQYEPILYGWPEGNKHFWCGDRNQGDVWMIDKPQRNDLHPTMKPVALIEQAVENSSRRGDLVLDPFAGSGSTAVACESTGRHARLVEIDPLYVDVIVRRWQNYTGRLGVLKGDDRCFDELSSERLAQIGVKDGTE